MVCLWKTERQVEERLRYEIYIYVYVHIRHSLVGKYQRQIAQDRMLPLLPYVYDRELRYGS